MYTPFSTVSTFPDIQAASDTDTNKSHTIKDAGFWTVCRYQGECYSLVQKMHKFQFNSPQNTFASAYCQWALVQSRRWCVWIICTCGAFFAWFNLHLCDSRVNCVHRQLFLVPEPLNRFMSVFNTYYVLKMITFQRSWQFYIAVHYSEIIPQLVDTVCCKLVNLFPS